MAIRAKVLFLRNATHYNHDVTNTSTRSVQFTSVSAIRMIESISRTCRGSLVPHGKMKCLRFACTIISCSSYRFLPTTRFCAPEKLAFWTLETEADEFSSAICAGNSAGSPSSHQSSSQKEGGAQNGVGVKREMWTQLAALQLRTPLSLSSSLTGTNTNGEADSPSSMYPSGAPSFTFTIRKADGLDLGLNILHHELDQILRIEGVRPDGAVDAWNRQCASGTAADKMVCPGLRSSVNRCWCYATLTSLSCDAGLYCFTGAPVDVLCAISSLSFFLATPLHFV